MTLHPTALALIGIISAGVAFGAGVPSPLPAATPESAGLSTLRLERMASFFSGEVDRKTGAGYVLMVARNGKLIYSKAIGERNREHHLPMTFDTRFRIMSMTKPVTAVAVLMLYEEGRFQLDDSVANFLPEFANPRVFTGVDAEGRVTTEAAKRPISIRHLLTHTAGLGYAPGYDLKSPVGKLYGAAKILPTRPLAENIRELAGLPLYTQPGDAWRYSYADDVLGRLVEVVSGMPYDRFLQARLLGPLGMTHTGFYVPAADAGLLATTYKHDPSGDLVPSAYFSTALTDPVVPSPGGGAGLISTAGDYLRFAQMLANGGSFEGKQYLSPVTVALMTSNQVPEDAMFKYWGDDSKGLGYGLSISIIIDAASSPQADCVGDFYWGGLLNTRWIASPRTGLVAVLFNQLDRSGDKGPLRTDQDFHNLLFASIQALDAAPGSAACMAAH